MAGGADCDRFIERCRDDDTAVADGLGEDSGVFILLVKRVWMTLGAPRIERLM